MNHKDQECIEWAEGVLHNEGLEDWKIEFSPSKEGYGYEGICLQDSKVIVIHWLSGLPNHALMLHEIAHAIAGSGHDSEFAHQFMFLVEKYFERKRS